MEFKNNDAVFCPSLTNKPLLVNVKEGQNGMTLSFRGKSYWHTIGGFAEVGNVITSSPYPRNLPSVFLATEENRQILSKLYSIEFESANQIRIYAVNETNCYGEATNRWLYHFRGMYCSFDMSDYGDDIPAFKKCDILMSPNPSDLKKALSSEPFGKIICIGHDSIDNWAYEVIDEG